jgi:hypothetical protein
MSKLINLKIDRIVRPLNKFNPSKIYKKLKTRTNMKHFCYPKSSYYLVKDILKVMYVVWHTKSFFQAEFS